MYLIRHCSVGLRGLIIIENSKLKFAEQETRMRTSYHFEPERRKKSVKMASIDDVQRTVKKCETLLHRALIFR